MKAGERVRWRAHFNQLISRPIPESEYPKIVKKMFEDGLVGVVGNDGVKWYSGRYLIKQVVVRDIWKLSKSQWIKFHRWVYIENPFSVLLMVKCEECGVDMIDDEEVVVCVDCRLEKEGLL